MLLFGVQVLFWASWLRDWLQAVALTQQGDMHQAVQGLKTRCVDRIYSEGDERLSAVVRSYILLRLEPDRLFQIENNRLVCCHLFPFIATSKRRILPSPQELNVFSTEIFFCHSHFEKCLNSYIKSCFFQSGMSTRCLDSSDYLIMWSSCWYLPWDKKKTTKKKLNWTAGNLLLLGGPLPLLTLILDWRFFCCVLSKYSTKNKW